MTGHVLDGPGRHRQRPVDSASDTPATRCYYADDPTHRPHCQLTATLRYGSVPLCASCAAQRSTLGKGQPPTALPTSAPFDVLGWVATAHHHASTAENTLTAAITRARQAGASWSAIGAQLGISRQAAQQRYARTHPKPTTRPMHPNRPKPGG